MAVLRKDYILDRWVIIAEKRGKRPYDFKREKTEKKDSLDVFAPANEHLTPKEIGRIEKNGKWSIRWVPNKFAFVSNKKFLSSSKKYLQEMPAFGYHEVIVETPNSTKQLWDMSKSEIKDILKVYSDRIKELSKRKNIKYVQLFKNHGKQGGTSLLHSHTQAVAIAAIPPNIKEKLDGIKKNKLSYGTLAKRELKTKRKAIITKHFISICPFASRFSYEIWIFPKRHYKSITDMPDNIIMDFANIMQKILKKLKKMNCSYNFHFHYAPKGKDMLFHVEITPRIENWAGFEYSTGIIVNTVAPETAAKFYRGKN